MQFYTRTQSQLKSLHHGLYTRSSSLWCASAAEHHILCLGLGSSTKPRKHLSKSNLSLNTRQDFLNMPNLWEASLETERRCFSKVILESNATPSILKSTDSFSTVSSIVNRSNYGCIVCDLETIIYSLSLARIEFHPAKVTPPTNFAEGTVQELCN